MEYRIRDEETERAVHELAELTGLSADEALKRVVTARLDEERDYQRRWKELSEWLASRGPIPSGPSQEEIDAEMYDEDGLPR